MNSKYALLCITVAAAILLPNSATASGIIEDTQLEKIVNQKLQHSNQLVTPADVSKITNLLEYTPSGIKSLKGLEHAVSLSELLLTGNEIEDLEPLRGLNRLTFFYMNHNKISNLEPLKDLTRLRNVDLDYNNVNDISPLKKSIQLSMLRLENNPVEDISLLSEMKNLKGLNIANTSVRDIRPLENLPHLEFIFMNDTEVSDLTPLRSLPALHTLYLKNNPLSEESLQVIEELRARNVRIIEPENSLNQITSHRDIKVILNGKELLFEQSPVLLNQTTVVPMRNIYSALGATIEWDDAERKATAVIGKRTIELRVGSRMAKVDGKPQLLGEKVMLVNDTVVIPVRFISESLGAKVDWNEETSTVGITTSAAAGEKKRIST